MFLSLLHPGDLSFWELVWLLAVYALMLLVVIGLPISLTGFIIYKVVKYHREMRQLKSPD